MDFSDLKKYKEILVKPKGFSNYYPMDVTQTENGFTVSNFEVKPIRRLTEHEHLFIVNNQEDLDKLDCIHLV